MALFLALVAWIVFQIWGWEAVGFPRLDLWPTFWVGFAGSLALLAIFRDK